MNLNREEFQHSINKSFIREVQEFKVMLFSKLSPKRGFQEGEYVTGEGKLKFYEGRVLDKPVSYTHLTLPTICSV